MKPLKKQKIITPEESKIIFSNVEQIQALNSKFLEIYQKKHESLIGPYCCIIDKDLINTIPLFKVYSDYFHNLTRAQETVKILKNENDQLYDFLDDIEMTPTINNNDLLGFLQMPVDRLFKYQLLFNELLKKTDPEHPDYVSIKTVIAKFSIVCKYNE